MRARLDSRHARTCARRSAASKKLSRLDFAIGDAHVLPFADGSFDIALISYSLHHMPEPERVIGEMARVIGRGGRMGILDIRAPEDPDIARCSNLIERVRDSSHTRTLARSEFENILTARGLRVAAIEAIEDVRDFDHWMHVAGWKPGDRERYETRRLMEAKQFRRIRRGSMRNSPRRILLEQAKSLVFAWSIRRSSFPPRSYSRLGAGARQRREMRKCLAVPTEMDKFFAMGPPVPTASSVTEVVFKESRSLGTMSIGNPR